MNKTCEDIISIPKSIVLYLENNRPELVSYIRGVIDNSIGLSEDRKGNFIEHVSIEEYLGCIDNRMKFKIRYNIIPKSESKFDDFLAYAILGENW
jgi:hypothetical protein